MTEGSDKRVPPDVQALLRTLKAYSVEFVVAGSVAVEAWGADVGVPGDLDIVPATNRRNLERLVNAMRQVNAQSWPVTGRWVSGDGGGTTWEEYVDNDPRRGQPLPDADPDNIETLDSLFSTRHGELDIVPWISGTFEELIHRAAVLPVRGVDNVDVMSIDDLLVHLTVPRRKKDVGRVAVLRGRQRESSRS